MHINNIVYHFLYPIGVHGIVWARLGESEESVIEKGNVTGWIGFEVLHRKAMILMNIWF